MVVETGNPELWVPVLYYVRVQAGISYRTLHTK